MSGITRAFEVARSENRAALIPYIMSGYPDQQSAVEIALALGRGGADLVEIGMPFSDPLADGPTIQHAANVSLAGGTTVERCLETAATVRKQSDMPLVLMGYYNPIYRYGVERFCRDAAEAGVEGLILPDLPPEEAVEARNIAQKYSVDIIFLVAPTSTEERIRRATQVAGGFVYCVSLTGVTGARASVSAGLDEFLGRVRRHTDLPLAVGFGISKPEHARAVAQVADGVVVASALIDLIDNTEPTERLGAVEEYISGMRAGAIKSAPVGAAAGNDQLADDRLG